MLIKVKIWMIWQVLISGNKYHLLTSKQQVRTPPGPPVFTLTVVILVNKNA